jgi:hypothetical protein
MSPRVGIPLTQTIDWMIHVKRPTKSSSKVSRRWCFKLPVRLSRAFGGKYVGPIPTKIAAFLNVSFVQNVCCHGHFFWTSPCVEFSSFSL